MRHPLADLFTRELTQFPQEIAKPAAVITPKPAAVITRQLGYIPLRCYVTANSHMCVWLPSRGAGGTDFARTSDGARMV